MNQTASDVSIQCSTEPLAKPRSQNLTNKVAIVSAYFPPSTLAGVHRARLLARHLPSFDWEPIIFCIDERYHTEHLDPDLAQLVPMSTRIVKCRAVQASLARPLGIGDITLRGFFWLRQALFKFLEQESADVVLITVGPFYTALLAPLIKRRFAIPVVIDFQDPWISNWGASQPRWTKAGLAHWLSTVLEPRAIADADHITCISQRANTDLKARYLGIAADQFSAIPIGGDAYDFEYLAANPLKEISLLPKDGLRHIVYVGTLWPSAFGTLRLLLRGFGRLRRERPEIAESARLHFIGTSKQRMGNQRTRESDSELRIFAEEAGVSDLVQEIPHRVDYLRALRILSEAHGVLALGSDEPHYSASKIYPILLSGTPALAIFLEESDVCEILQRCGGARLIRFSSGERLEGREAEVAEALAELIQQPEDIPSVDRDALEAYSAEAVAGQFASIFRRIIPYAPAQP